MLQYQRNLGRSFSQKYSINLGSLVTLFMESFIDGIIEAPSLVHLNIKFSTFNCNLFHMQLNSTKI